MKITQTFLFILSLLQLSCPQDARTNESVSTIPVPITNMVLLPAGTIIREGKPTLISTQLWIGKYEINQREFAEVMGKNPSHFTNAIDAPVEKVTFNDAVAFCSNLTLRERTAGRLSLAFEYRLPWEVEWEYACLAGSTNRYSFGPSPDKADAYAWTAENSENKTHPVGHKLPNAWGLHDMHGNVWEWCLDWFKPDLSNPKMQKLPTGKFKIFKGGGWNQDAQFAGAANRFMMDPANGINFVGFRIVLAPVAPKTAR